VHLRGDRSLDHEWELSTADHVEIAGRSVLGLDHAIAALLQLLAGEGGKALPLCVLHDESGPFAGILVDCSSAVVPVASLQEAVRLCWLYRVPNLLLQFGGDAAFTFPSRAFPELVTPGRGYTRGELVDLIAYARVRGVALAPALELGHAAAIVRQKPAWGLPGPERTGGLLHLGRQQVLDGVGSLLDEVLELFPESTFVHLGGAMVDGRAFADDPAAAAALQRCGGKEPADLCAWFLGWLCAQCKAKGRTPLLWQGFAPAQSRFVPEYTVVCATTGSAYAPQQLLGTFPLLNASAWPLQIDGGDGARDAGTEALFAWEPHRFGGDPARAAAVTVLPAEAAVFGSLLCLQRLAGDGVVAALRARLPAYSERALRPETGRPLADFLGRFGRCSTAAGWR
ncbi:MAG TPA: family 20 glycosylhydrolase, partial [Planctomycetota bacterium]|nr:family 20 glycosylhydrolase [Planctomycetota bacterium]